MLLINTLFTFIFISLAASESPSPCSLPVVIGRCDAIIKRYAYNKDKEVCELFDYGGCGGNANNFRNLDDCKIACEPQNDRERRDSDTDAVEVNAAAASSTSAPSTNTTDCKKCPNEPYMTHYTELNCEAIYSATDKCCPIRYDCSKRNEQKVDKCYHEGREYNIGDELPDDLTPPCLVHCSCRENYEDKVPRISCVSVECPELFLGPLTEPNCVRQYTRKNCCSNKKLCGPEGKLVTDLTDVAKCNYGGKTYVEGQKFYPDENPCMTCLCASGFNGKLEAPFCEVAKCNLELHYSHYLRNKCVPVYYQDRCCPIEWRCPSEFNTTSTVTTSTMPEETDKSASSDENACLFGEMRFGKSDEVPKEIAGECVKCSCAVPPVLTCVKNYNDC